MSDQPPQKKADEGSPAWVMTFADLMSLLMCFFVLLLSFSEMDVVKFKQLAGSMKLAFGVQREIKAKEPPKGINVIAREFSPGRPEPTSFKVIRQMTTSENNINLDLGKERRKPVPTHDPDSNRGTNAGESKGNKTGESSQTAGLTKAQKQELQKAKQMAEARLDEKLKTEGVGDSGSGGYADEKALEEKIKARVAADRQKRLEESARLISNALGREIKSGSVDVEIEDKKIIIRVREKASFGSGSADLKSAFRPLLGKVAKILKGSEGKIIVAGHTDDIPIYTERFRSNWELSSARAVSVVHQMIKAGKMPASRFLIEGYADTRPLVPNKSAKNRSKNRRVEIILQQGDDKEAPIITVSEQSDGKQALAAEQNKQIITPDGKKSVKPAAANVPVKAKAAGKQQVKPLTAPKPTEQRSGSSKKKLGIKAAGSR